MTDVIINAGGQPVTVTINNTGIDDGRAAEILQRLSDQGVQIAQLVAQGGQMASFNQETRDILSQLNDYTNSMAEVQSAQTQMLQAVASQQQEGATRLEEISSDIDDLIANATDASLRDQAQALKDRVAEQLTAQQDQASKLQTAVTTSDAQVQRLQQIAAKHDTPVPTDPVPPPPPVDDGGTPPVDDGGTTPPVDDGGTPPPDDGGVITDPVTGSRGRRR